MAYRTRELASLPVGDCYWLLKGKTYKGRRIHIMKPLDLPFSPMQVRKRIEAEMGKRIGREVAAPIDEPRDVSNRLAEVIAERSARRAKEAGIVDADAA